MVPTAIVADGVERYLEAWPFDSRACAALRGCEFAVQLEIWSIQNSREAPDRSTPQTHPKTSGCYLLFLLKGAQHCRDLDS